MKTVADKTPIALVGFSLPHRGSVASVPNATFTLRRTRE